jgi:hypothetical protein
MGFNTTVLILNDAFSFIEDNPEQFVAGIRSKMHEGGEFPVGNHCNAADVKPTMHADIPRVYVSHGNWLSELGPYANTELRKAQENEHVRKILIERCKQAKRIANDMLKTLNQME